MPEADDSPGGCIHTVDLAARFGGELPALAALDRPGRLLEVGGGAGSHAAALAGAVPGLEATVLDLPAVEPVVAERHPELAFVVGDLDRPRFGRPTAERWDAVLLANVLHDHPAGRARAIIATALFDLMMLVENERGAAWPAATLPSWLRAAGLTGIKLRRPRAPDPPGA